MVTKPTLKTWTNLKIPPMSSNKICIVTNLEGDQLACDLGHDDCFIRRNTFSCSLS